MDKFNSICVIVPDIGGGTLRHAREMASAWSNETTVIYIVYKERVYNIYIMQSGKVYKKHVLFIDGDMNIIRTLFKYYNVRLVHIHHFMYLKDEMMKFYSDLSIPYSVTLHDYYTVCPRIQLMSKGVFCDMPGVEKCNICINNGDRLSRGIFPSNIINITDWRNYWLKFLDKAESLFCPSHDQRKRILKVFPQLTDRLFMVENPEIIVPKYIPDAITNRKNTVNEVRIGVIGSISKIKGRDVILACAKFAESQSMPIKFIVFGTLKGVHSRHIPNNVIVLGRYNEQEVYQLIADNQVDFFWFPAIWPETYSYVLTIPIRMGIPVIASDIGAIAERIVKHGWGETYSLNSTPPDILGCLMNFEVSRYAAKGDFTIHNDKFSSINSFYSKKVLNDDTAICTDIAEDRNSLFEQHLYVCGKMNNLSWEEYKMLDKADDVEIDKIKLIAALDKRKFVSRGVTMVGRRIKMLFGKKI